MAMIDKDAAVEVAARRCKIAREKWEEYGDYGDFCEATAFRRVAIELEKLPELEHGRWIPCEERVPPSEKKSYWVCTDTGYQCQCRWTNANPILTSTTMDWHWNIFDLPQYTKVVAWMPLPAPWEGERHG